MLNGKPQHSNSGYQSQGRPTSVFPLITLRKSDYPNVKYWEKKQKNAVKISGIEVCGTDSGDSDQESNDNKKEEIGIKFLEDENGIPIDDDKKTRLYAKVRSFWNDNIDPNCPPNNWSSAGSALRDKFRDEIEAKYPFLRCCTGRWKVEALWKKNYHSWKTTFLARESKKKPCLSTGNSNDGGLRKQKESPKAADPHGEADELLDASQPKKAKKGMDSILTMSQSQKVHQLSAHAHSIIRKRG